MRFQFDGQALGPGIAIETYQALHCAHMKPAGWSTIIGVLEEWVAAVGIVFAARAGKVSWPETRWSDD
jgi:hypothetical protein